MGWNGSDLRTELAALNSDSSVDGLARTIRWINEIERDIFSRHDWPFSRQKGKILVTASEEEQIIKVQDRGMGVPEKDLPHLFEPFFRTDKSRNRNMGGVGLGLTLCKRIIEAHGGAISASNLPEGGTSICFTLPEKK